MIMGKYLRAFQCLLCFLDFQEPLFRTDIDKSSFFPSPVQDWKTVSASTVPSGYYNLRTSTEEPSDTPSGLKHNGPWHISYLTACAPSKESDQPAHLRSLIRIFAVRLKMLWIVATQCPAKTNPSRQTTSN